MINRKKAVVVIGVALAVIVIPFTYSATITQISGSQISTAQAPPPVSSNFIWPASQYGVLCNGSTDDWLKLSTLLGSTIPSFQTSVGMQTVSVENTTSYCQLNAGISLTGAHDLVIRGGVYRLADTATQGVFTFTNSYRITLENMTIINNTSQPGISLAGCTDCTLHNVTINRPYGSLTTDITSPSATSIAVSYNGTLTAPFPIQLFAMQAVSDGNGSVGFATKETMQVTSVSGSAPNYTLTVVRACLAASGNSCISPTPLGPASLFIAATCANTNIPPTSTDPCTAVMFGQPNAVGVRYTSASSNLHADNVRIYHEAYGIRNTVYPGAGGKWINGVVNLSAITGIDLPANNGEFFDTYLVVSSGVDGIHIGSEDGLYPNLSYGNVNLTNSNIYNNARSNVRVAGSASDTSVMTTDVDMTNNPMDSSGGPNIYVDYAGNVNISGSKITFTSAGNAIEIHSHANTVNLSGIFTSVSGFSGILVDGAKNVNISGAHLLNAGIGAAGQFYGLTITNGASNITASGLVSGNGVDYTFKITGATNANPVNFTISTPSSYPTTSPTYINGGTGNWAAVNGTYAATTVDSTHFTIPVDSSAFGTLTGSLTYTNSPTLGGVAICASTQGPTCISSSSPTNVSVLLSASPLTDGNHNILLVGGVSPTARVVDMVNGVITIPYGGGTVRAYNSSGVAQTILSFSSNGVGGANTLNLAGGPGGVQTYVTGFSTPMISWLPQIGTATLPTSCAGMPSHAIWNNGGALSICP